MRSAEPEPIHRNSERVWVPFILLAAANVMNAQLGVLLLGWLSDNAQVAAMRIAVQGSLLIFFSLSIVNHVIAPQIVRSYREGKNRQLQSLSRQSARAAFIVALPVALPMIFFGDIVIALLFGDKYVWAATLPLLKLAVAQLVNVAFGSVGLLLMMSGYEQSTLRGQFLGILIYSAAAVVLIPMFDATSAAIPAALGTIAWNALMAYQVHKRLGLRPSIF